jgi:hypothetical protein
LCSRWRRLAAAGKPKVVVTTAIAREMAGFIWAIARSTADDRLIGTNLFAQGGRINRAG